MSGEGTSAGDPANPADRPDDQVPPLPPPNWGQAADPFGFDLPPTAPADDTEPADTPPWQTPEDTPPWQVAEAPQDTPPWAVAESPQDAPSWDTAGSAQDAPSWQPSEPPEDTPPTSDASPWPAVESPPWRSAEPTVADFGISAPTTADSLSSPTTADPAPQPSPLPPPPARDTTKDLRRPSTEPADQFGFEPYRQPPAENPPAESPGGFQFGADPYGQLQRPAEAIPGWPPFGYDPQNAPQPAPAPPPAPPPGGAWTPQQQTPEAPSERKRRTGLLLGIGAGLVVVVLVVVVGVVVMSGGGGKKSTTTEQSAQSADQIFTGNPGVTVAGRDQQINGVAAVESTVVAVGGVSDSIADRAEFLVSTDGGQSFHLAPVRSSDGQPAPYGDTPKLVAGSPGSWAAIGSRQGTPGVWTSKDGTSWTHVADDPAFGASDRVNKLTKSASGFVAVGATSAKGDFTDSRPVVWLSADGTKWERLAGNLGPSVSAGNLSLTEVAANGSTVLAHAYGAAAGGKLGTIDTLWRSANGGRTWSQTSFPTPTGWLGLAIATGPSGFLLAQNIFAGSNHYAVISRSSDGTQWSKAGEVHLTGFDALIHLYGSSRGQVAVVQSGPKLLLARSEDGRSWSAGGEFPQAGGRTFAAAAATASSTITVGWDADRSLNTGLLTVLDPKGQPQPVSLDKIAGAAPDDRQIAALATANGRTVAVGSNNGDTGLWSTTDGRTWSRGTTDEAGIGRRRLLSVVYGSAGWLTVGYSGRDFPLPMFYISKDGSTWQPTTALASGTHLLPRAAAVGPAGYVVVGEDGGNAGTWHSTDLRTWERGTARTSKDLGGTARWMHGVVGGPFGYVAVGGLADPTAKTNPTRPAVWTSTDGKSWSVKQLPLPGGMVDGGFHTVVAKGTSLLAVGSGLSKTGVKVIASMSADGGKTWQEAQLPESAPPSIDTSVVATAHGFVIAGALGPLGSTNVVLWTSADGRSWQLTRTKGTGLTGGGDNRLTGMTVRNDQLLAVGVTGTYLGDHLTIWQRPLP